MNNKIKTILFTLLILMAGTKAYAADISAKNSDGVTIYYKYINYDKELAVTYRNSKYSSYDKYKGDVVIPNQVIYKDKILKVTAIDTHAFYECSSLQSIIIPNSVTSIGERAFSGCTSLKSINMPNSVTSVGDNAFSKCSNLYSVTIGEGIELIGDYAFSYCGMLTEVYCLAKDVPRGDDGIFLNCFLDRATLHVPAGSIESYKKVSPWKKFKNIVALGSESSDNPTGEKCATPTIKYNKGKLVFNCSTEGSVCYSTITDVDVASYMSNEIDLTVTYYVSVYATKDGYRNSETATATLCWIDVDPKTEGIVNGVASVRSYGVMIQASEGFFNISGLEVGTPISVYNTAGQMVGSAKAASETTIVNTTLRNGEIGIVKIGDKSVKVVMK